MLQNQPSGSFTISMIIIWAGLFTGPIVFAAICYFLRTTGQFTYVSTEELNRIMIYVVPFVIIAALFGSNFLYRNHLKAINKMTTPEEKLSSFRSVLIIRYALPEMAAFLALVAFLLSGDLRFMAGAGVMLVWMTIIFPTRGRIATDLELPTEFVS
jgi:hypothetical protein